MGTVRHRGKSGGRDFDDDPVYDNYTEVPWWIWIIGAASLVYLFAALAHLLWLRDWPFEGFWQSFFWWMRR